jgi:hypothetical protein
LEHFSLLSFLILFNDKAFEAEADRFFKCYCAR